MRISDWSSDVCSSDLNDADGKGPISTAMADMMLVLGISGLYLLINYSAASLAIFKSGGANHMLATIVILLVALGVPQIRQRLMRPAARALMMPRSEERRVGEECVSPCNSWWLP